MPSTEPVTWAAAVAGAISAVLVALVSLNIIQLTPEQQAAVLGAVVAVLPIVGALWARQQSTSLADPKDKDGTPLVRPGGAQPLEVQQRGMRGG